MRTLIERIDIARLLRAIRNNPNAVNSLKHSPALLELPAHRRKLIFEKIDECLNSMKSLGDADERLTKRQKRNLKNAHKFVKLKSHISTAYNDLRCPIDRSAASMMVSGRMFSGVVRKKRK